MKLRALGKDGPLVPEIGLGCWQLGGGWGKAWDDAIAQDILEQAYQSGVRFIDTADVYGDGASERSIGKFLQRPIVDSERLQIREHASEHSGIVVPGE